MIIVIAGTALMSAISHVKAKAALTQQIVNEIDHITMKTAASMSSWIEDRKLDIDNWSKQGIYKTALLTSFLGLTARDFADEQLKRIKQDYGYYADIVLADAAGNIIAASDKELIGKLNVSDRPYFKTALEGRTHVSKHIFESRVTHKTVFTIASPVMDNDQVLGVLFAVFDVYVFTKEFIHDIRVGQSGYAYIVFDNGLITTHPERNGLFGRNINEFNFGHRIKASQEGFLEYELENNSMLAFYKKFGEMEWTLVVCAVREEVFAPIKNLANMNMMVAFIVVLMLFFVIFLITQSLSRPLKEVVAGLEKMGEGHLEYRINISSTDEVGEIGLALNNMAQNLQTSNQMIKQQTILLENARDDLEIRVQERTFELKKAEEKYRSIFENAVEGIFQIDQKGYVLSANPALASIFGYPSVKDLILNKIEELTSIPSDQKGMFLKMQEEGKEIIAHEIKLYRKDKTEFWASVFAKKIYDENNRVKYYEGFILDISEKKAIEDEKRKARAAEEANIAKSEFLANMSHEIRTPLNVILGFSDLMSREVSDPKYKTYTDAIQMAGKGLLKLINDILDLSKIEAGMMDILYAPVSLTTLFEEIRQIFMEKTTSKKIDFIIEMDEHLPLVLELDETRIRQILLNLVGNAVKFTDSGHIRLKALKTSGIKENGVVDIAIKVEDTGPGIAKEDMTRIFDPFTQVGDQLVKKHGGTGLGLSICNRLTKAMNGQVKVMSTPGQGSCFEVSLRNVKIPPGDGHQIPAASEAETYSRYQFEKRKVLIVDDIRFNRFLLKELLEKFNQDVLEAQSGLEALSMARHHKPDMIVMDIRMPGMDGNETTLRLKADPETKQIPVIALTGDIVSTAREKIMEKGYDGYLTKPVKIDALLFELARFLPHTLKDLQDQQHRSDTKEVFDVMIHHPEELILKLRTHILPRCKSFANSMVIAQIKDFGEELLLLSMEHRAQSLADKSRELIGNADAFDIIRINKNIEELPVLIEEMIDFIQKTT